MAMYEYEIDGKRGKTAPFTIPAESSGIFLFFLFIYITVKQFTTKHQNVVY